VSSCSSLLLIGNSSAKRPNASAFMIEHPRRVTRVAGRRHLERRQRHMSDKKTIAVIGATGAQGGGLARAILADPERRFAVRAITRKIGSDKARALAAAGAEVAAGDADDPASLERAFAGAHGAFLVTNFWEHLS